MRKKTSLKDIAVIGLALFAMFFGAGNLIFPPYLGTNAGSEWFIGFMCFFIADVGLALVAILSMIKGGDVSIQGVTKKLGSRGPQHRACEFLRLHHFKAGYLLPCAGGYLPGAFPPRL